MTDMLGITKREFLKQHTFLVVRPLFASNTPPLKKKKEKHSIFPSKHTTNFTHKIPILQHFLTYKSISNSSPIHRPSHAAAPPSPTLYILSPINPYLTPLLSIDHLLSPHLLVLTSSFRFLFLFVKLCEMHGEYESRRTEFEDRGSKKVIGELVILT